MNSASIHPLDSMFDIDEILARLRGSVVESGITQEELDQFFKAIRKEIAAEKQASCYS
ncbi:MAG: hypothetical protein QM703_09200 [Gemmatales bacterium]